MSGIDVRRACGGALASFAAIAAVFWTTAALPARGDEIDDLIALHKRVQTLYEAGKYAQAEPLARELLQRGERAFKDQPANLASLIENAGMLYTAEGKYSLAEPLYQRALKIRQASFGADHSSVAQSLYSLAKLYRMQGKYATAEPLFQRAIRIQEKTLGPDNPALAWTLNDLGLLYGAQGKYAAAEPLHQRALKIWQQALGPDHLDVANALDSLASLYREQGKYAQGEPLLQRALRIRERNLGANHPAVAQSLNDLALLYGDEGKHVEAAALLERAVKISEQRLGPQHPMAGAYLNNLGIQRTELGEYAAAEALFLRALTIRETSLGPEHPDVARSLVTLGMLYDTMGRYSEVEPLYRRALRIWEKNFGVGHPLVSTTLNSLGVLFFTLGDSAAAEPLFQQVLKSREKSLGPDHAAIADSLNNLAVLYSSRGQYADAEPLLERALKIREKNVGPNGPEVAAALNNLATLYLDQGQFAEAEALFQRALKIQERSLGSHHPDVALTLNNLALLYKREGNLAQAEPLYERALGIQEKSLGAEHPRVAEFLNNLALLKKAQGKNSEAETLFRRALAIREKSFGPDHPDVAVVLNNLGWLYRAEGKYAEAEPLVDRAISIWEHSGASASTRYHGYMNRASLEWLRQRKSEAVADLREAMRLAEEQRTRFSGAERERAVGFAQFGSAFETMVAWQNALNDLPAAFEAMERSQARALVDQINAAGCDLLSGLPPQEAAALRERDFAARSRVTYLERQLRQLEGREGISAEARQQQRTSLEQKLKQARDAAEQAYDAIRSASPALRLASGKDFAPAALDKVQAWLAARNALLLRYYSGDNQLYLLAVAPHEPARLITLAVDKELALAQGVEPGPITPARLQSLLTVSGASLTKLLANPDTAAQATARLAALWKILLPEESRKLAIGGTFNQLVIVPDGPLALLPFEALVVEERSDPRYLFDVAPPIVYGPSATVVYNLAEREAEATPSNVKPVLTVADPAYPAASGAAQAAASKLGAGADFSARSRYRRHGGELARLPYSGTEALWVVDDFSKSGIAVGKLLGAEATEANVRLNVKGREVVHLACHGLADESYGNLFGALALTPGKDAANPADDGFLTLAEIYNLDLRSCELAILSACETNYGPQQKGEGTWALSRGFLAAGARRVVASNWLVDDEAAASLISYFCSGVAQSEKKGEPTDYAAKLHAAKRWVRQQEKWKSPYYWGTFVLVGPN
ncbi:MAG TPA: tetratricopeptide repeat protein [Pirellulales bacterium]|nr:tetratricopeptide repeat protein [Pirellulales bacterium]